MKESIFEIKENIALTANVHRLVLRGDTSAIKAAGQFVNLLVDGFFLRRPFSVCDWDDSFLTVIIKETGHGTEKLAKLLPGTKLSALTGLGNGFHTEASGNHPVLLAGGSGLSPMYCLAKRLREQGKNVCVILGFNTAADVFYEEEFKALGCDVSVTTLDGSYGGRGFVTDALPAGGTYTYACGPEPMLKAVYEATELPGEYSFEMRMGCGFGACMGCSSRTRNGMKRVCKDGPVLKKEEILWED